MGILSTKLPANNKESFLSSLRLQFSLDLLNEPFTILIDLILSIKKTPPTLLAVRLERLDLLLPRQFFLQREGRRSGATGFLDLAINVLDLPLKTDFQVIGPVVELRGLGLEEGGVALGDPPADAGLFPPGDFIERWRCGFCQLAHETAGD